MSHLILSTPKRRGHLSLSPILTLHFFQWFEIRSNFLTQLSILFISIVSIVYFAFKQIHYYIEQLSQSLHFLPLKTFVKVSICKYPILANFLLYWKRIQYWSLCKFDYGYNESNFYFWFWKLSIWNDWMSVESLQYEIHYMKKNLMWLTLFNYGNITTI